MGEVDTLIRAFEGASGIFSVQNFWELGLAAEVRLGTNVIEAARAVGNPHVVYSSGLGAERLQGVAAIDAKAMLEERLRQSGLPFTILRPGLFMDDFLGASLPFARPIQRILRGHRLVVGRLFLAALVALLPETAIVPLTTLDDVGRMTLWAFGRPGLSQGRGFSVIGSIESPTAMSRPWTETRRQSIPHIPGVRFGMELLHPNMAKLLRWLGNYHNVQAEHSPIALETYTDWLHRLPPG